MDFGELRSAVQRTMDNPKEIGQVIWCVLMSRPKAEALSYAVDALARIDHGHVNLGQLVAFAVESEDGLVAHLETHFDCPKHIWCEFLAAWGFSVIYNANNSPALSIDSKGYPIVMAWDDSSWVIRFEEPESKKTLDRVDWSQWKSIPDHLKEMD